MPLAVGGDKALADRLKAARLKKAHKKQVKVAAGKKSKKPKKIMTRSVKATPAEDFAAEHLTKKRGQSLTILRAFLTVATFYIVLGGGELPPAWAGEPEFASLATAPMTKARKLELTAKLANVDVRTAAKAVDAWENERVVKNWDEGVRGGAAPTHPSAIAHRKADTLEGFIEDYCTEHLANALSPLTRLSITKAVYNKTGEHISGRQLTRILHKLDIDYARVFHVPNEDKRAEHDWLRIFFLAKYAHVLKELEEGKAYVADIDESSVGTTHSSKFGLRPNNAPFGRHVSKSKGQTMCFAAGISKDGVVADYTTDGKIVMPLFEPPEGTAPVASSEQIFMAKKRTRGGDYHQHFNQVWFQTYLRDNLIPALKAQFPDAFPSADGRPATKKVYVLLDNAPYHAALVKKGEGSIEGMSRVEIVNLLRKHNVEKLVFPVMNKKTKAIVNWEFSVKDDAILKQSSALPLDALVWCAKTTLADKTPELFRNAAECIAADAGVELLWVPPCTPAFSPIEEFFARVKKYVAFSSTGMSQPKDTAKRLQEGMYTSKLATPDARVTGGNFVLPRGPKPGKSVATVKGGCESAAALWRHQRENMDNWIATRCPEVHGTRGRVRWLSGTMANLEVHPEVLANLWRCKTRETMLAWVRKMVANMVGYKRAVRAEEAAAVEAGGEADSEDSSDEDSDSSDE